MATIGEMIVKLLADTSNFNASMDEAAAKVTASNDAMAASMASSMQSFRDFDNIQKGSIQTAEDLAQAQAALQAAQASGAFTTEELAAKEALVAQAMKNVGSETEAASGFLSMFTRNSRTMYSTSALITDAMTGQFSRMRREVAALGNETGLMAQAFRFAVSPAGMIAAALAAIALDAYNATQRINELQHAVLAGGGASGLSGDQLETMAEGFKKMGFDIQSARDAENALAQSGRVTQSDMANATQASLAYAQITGEKIETLAKKFAGVGTEGATGFIKLDESMHFLTDSQRENIAELAKQGETAKAVSVGYSALATHGMMALQQLQDEGKKTEGFWAGVGTVIQNANDSMMKGMGFGLTKQDELDKTNKLIAYYRQIGVSNEKINELIQKRAALEAQIASTARTATARGAGAQSGIQSDEKLLHGGLHEKGSGNVTAQLEAQLKQQEAEQKVSYDQRQEFEVEYWGQILATAKKGSAEYVAAWQHTQDLQKQIDDQQLAASNRAAHARTEAERKAAEAARQANEQRLQTLHQERDATEADTQARIAADQRIVAFAAQAYGKMSSQYTAALHQMQADTAAFAAKQRQLIEQGAEGTEKVAEKRIAIQRQSLQEQYDAHQITAAQMLQAELKLDDDLLQAQLAYLRKKEQLDAGDVAAVAKDQRQITIVTLDAQQRRLQDLDHFHKQAEQKWRQYTQRVDGMVSSQVTAMLFQHQTLRGAIANILESITGDWIKNEIEQLTQTQAAGAAKVAANVMSDQATVASHTAAAVETKAISAATGKTEIGNSAASAAAKAFNAMAGIPIVGPVLGAIAAAATFVAVEAFGANIASARGGWERVPADGMVTELHRDEMVLPKHVADPMRNMARNGGGNAGGAIHIHATDAASFKDFLRRNPGILAGGMRHAAARGHL